jgi:hypothetical protein
MRGILVGRDARVETAISHWAPRLISNGVLLADFQEVTGQIERWEDWCAAWCLRAADHEGFGRAALEDGYHLTAGEHLSRAAVYYHFAKFMFVNDVAQMRARTRRRSSASNWRCRICVRRGSVLRFPIAAPSWQAI